MPIGFVLHRLGVCGEPFEHGALGVALHGIGAASHAESGSHIEMMMMG
jgi:hypothetical protein